MKSNLIKKITLIASVVLTLTIFGATTPLDRCIACEPSHEQIVLFAAEAQDGGAAAIGSAEASAASATSDHATTIGTEDSSGSKWGEKLQSLFLWDMWRLILGGLKTTAIIFVFAAIAAILLGMMLAYLAISHKCPWLFKPLNWFVTTIHDIPSVALMMFFYYVIFAGELNGILVSIIALGVYTSGSLVKVFKIHIMQVGNGQIEAGRALGMTTRQCYQYIVLPQAVKSMMPLVIAELKVQLRATSYAGYIAQKDLIKAVFAVQDHYADMFVPLLIASVLYLILSWMIARVIQFLCVKLFNYD